MQTCHKLCVKTLGRNEESHYHEIFPQACGRGIISFTAKNLPSGLRKQSTFLLRNLFHPF